MDESYFKHNTKHDRGRTLEGEVWVFGMVDKSHNPAISYIEAVPSRSARTLYFIVIPVLSPNIGVIVHTDRWVAYNRLQSKLNVVH